MRATVHVDAKKCPNRREVAKLFFKMIGVIENNTNTSVGLSEAYEIIINLYSNKVDTLIESYKKSVKSKLLNTSGKFKRDSSITKFLKGEGNEITNEEKDAWIAFLSLLENNTPNIIRNNSGVSFNANYSEVLLNSLFEKFKTNTNNSSNINNSSNPIVDYFSKEYALNDKSVNQFLMAFPDVLWHFISNGNNSTKTVSDQINFNRSKNIKSTSHNHLPQFKKNTQQTEYKDINNFNNFYFGQSQNPNKEQLSLILEYGKLFRIKDVFNKNLKIIFPELEWSKLNDVWIDIKEEEDLSEKNIKFRRKILLELGLENSALSTKSTIKNVVKDYSTQLNVSDYDDIETFQSECEFLFNLYDFIINSKFYGDIGQVSIPDNNEFYQTDSMRAFNSTAKETRNLIIHPLYSKFPLEIISIVHSHFKRKINENTFFYILIQKMAQFTFNDSIKLGVVSEFRFDRSFVRWDNLMGQFYKNETTIEKTSIYYAPYYWGDNKSNYTLPYYWPSGTLNNSKYDKNQIEKKIILLDDNPNKVSSLVNATPIDEILRQLADLLSFLHFYTKGEQDDKKLLEIFNEFDSKLTDAFCIEEKDEMPTNQFLGLFMYKYQMPYYVFPYISLLSKEKAEIDIRQLFISLVSHTIAILDYKKIINDNN